MNFWRFLSCRQTAIRLTHYAIEIDKETKHWFTFRCMSNGTSPQSEKNDDSKHDSNTPKYCFAADLVIAFVFISPLYVTYIRYLKVNTLQVYWQSSLKEIAPKQWTCTPTCRWITCSACLLLMYRNLIWYILFWQNTNKSFSSWHRDVVKFTEFELLKFWNNAYSRFIEYHIAVKFQ